MWGWRIWGKDKRGFLILLFYIFILCISMYIHLLPLLKSNSSMTQNNLGRVSCLLRQHFPSFSYAPIVEETLPFEKHVLHT